MDRHVERPASQAATGGPQLVHTVTDSFRASDVDKVLVAQFVQSLGYDPRAVTDLRVVADRGTLKVEVTRRDDMPGRG